jgi:transglutaminase-like putative cysteine protease
VMESVIEIRTTPPTQEDQIVLGYKLRISPSSLATGYRDGFGNKVDLFNIMPPHSEVVIRASSCVRLQRPPVHEQLKEVSWSLDLACDVDSQEFLRTSPLVDFSEPVRMFASSVDLECCGSVLEIGEAIMRAVRSRMSYEKQVTAAHTRVSESLALGRGVCQDFAHLFLATARLRGLPARYVSGYIHQPGEIATHAWVQIWTGPGYGWVNLDPTHGKWVVSEHVVTAVGRDFSDVPPNRGVWKGDAEEKIAVTVNVQPVERVPSDLMETADAQGWAGHSGAPGQVKKDNAPATKPTAAVKGGERLLPIRPKP